jgi:hypothetical protein
MNGAQSRIGLARRVGHLRRHAPSCWPLRGKVTTRPDWPGSAGDRALAVTMGGVDALVFAAGVGEPASESGNPSVPAWCAWDWSWIGTPTPPAGHEDGFSSSPHGRM